MPKPSKASPFEQLKGDDETTEPDPKDKALEALQEQLAAAKDAHREERFIWIVISVILIDVLWFRNASNAIVPVIVLVLELVVLFILANRLDIQEVKGLFERIMQGIGRSGTGG